MLQENANKYADIFGSDIVTSDIVDRANDMFGDHEEHLCDSYEKVIYPTTGKTQDGSELFIFNTNDYKQGVRVSMCRNTGQPCNWATNFPNEYKTECKQQMVYRQLLSLSADGQPIKNHFEFPACCSCVLHKG